jgi:hypothetical protein
MKKFMEEMRYGCPAFVPGFVVAKQNPFQIEEGEVDADRGRQFAACFRRLFKKEQDELMRQQREERLAKKREAAQVA